VLLLVFCIRARDSVVEKPGLGEAGDGLFHNCFWSLPQFCFHWDTTHPVEPCGTGSEDSKAVALFQKGQSGSSCSAPFWNSSLDHFVTLPTRQQFKCDSPESTVLQDRLRINCAADARVLSEIELPAMSQFRQVRGQTARTGEVGAIPAFKELRDVTVREGDSSSKWKVPQWKP
jgi:hypothetical protein